MKMKKVIGMLLCLIMVLSVLPVFANAEECVHANKTPATCTAKEQCTDCGAAFGEPKGHQNLKPATCTAKAICNDCGEAVGEPKGHKNLQPATCTAKAICNDCGEAVGEPNGHNFQKVTCLGKPVCSVCGAAEGEPYGHNFQKVTCLGKPVCADCGAAEGEPYGHNFGEATCVSKPVCADCGAAEGALKPHTYASSGICTGCQQLAGTASATLSTTQVTYNGTAHKPAVKVTAGDVVIDPSYYTVTYTDNKNAGTATVTISISNFGTVTKNFTILPATLTVGVNDITINQNQGQPSASLYFSGLVGGDTVSIAPAPTFEFYATNGQQTWLDDPVNFMGKYTIKWTNANQCALTISSGNGNYIVHTVTTGTLNVIPTKAYFDMAGVKTYATVDGYAVNMHAMSDKNLDKILDNPNKEGTIELKFKPVSCLNYINTVRIPTALVEAIAEAANDAKSDVKALEVTLINGRSIKLDAKALDSIAEEAEGKFVAIVMVKSNDVKTAVDAEPLTKAQKKGLGDRPAYVFSIISGKEILDEDIEGGIVMQIPYKTRYKETEEGLKVYSIDEDGNRTAVETSYNENTEKVVWNADSLGFYVIEHEAAKK